MFGLTEKTLVDIRQSIRQVEKIDKVIIYGSRAKGNYRTGSDIDITLFGDNLTLDDSIYPLMGLLDDLYLPYMFDISIFEKITSQNLKEHINRVGKVFYEKYQNYE